MGNDDRCYECAGYGDDYFYDVEKNEFVSACDTCLFNEDEWDNEWDDPWDE